MNIRLCKINLRFFRQIVFEKNYHPVLVTVFLKIDLPKILKFFSFDLQISEGLTLLVFLKIHKQLLIKLIKMDIKNACKIVLNSATRGYISSPLNEICTRPSKPQEECITKRSKYSRLFGALIYHLFFVAIFGSTRIM